jgi:hypothetical protein
VYGGFTCTQNLSRFVEKVLSLLESGVAFYTVLPALISSRPPPPLSQFLSQHGIVPNHYYPFLSHMY